VDGLARSRAFLPIVSRAAVAGWESIEADAECDNLRPDAPPLEVCAQYLVGAYDRTRADRAKDMLERGISYEGSDPVGPMRTGLVAFATRVVMQHFESVRDALLGHAYVAADDSATRRKMAESAVSRLVDELNERAVEHLTR
jgi:hypothetical protein